MSIWHKPGLGLAHISKFDTIESLIAKKVVKVSPPKTPTMRPVSPDEILKDYYKK